MALTALSTRFHEVFTNRTSIATMGGAMTWLPPLALDVGICLRRELRCGQNCRVSFAAAPVVIGSRGQQRASGMVLCTAARFCDDCSLVDSVAWRGCNLFDQDGEHSTVALWWDGCGRSEPGRIHLDNVVKVTRNSIDQQASRRAHCGAQRENTCLQAVRQ